MSLDASARDTLQETSLSPRAESIWLAIWHSTLEILFPRAPSELGNHFQWSSHPLNYAPGHQPDQSDGPDRDEEQSCLIVKAMIGPSARLVILRTVLVIRIVGPEQWDGGVPALER
jgi:hypothetical protein